MVRKRARDLRTVEKAMLARDNKELLGARIGQALKAAETAVHCNGRWDVAWQYTNLSEVRPRAGRVRGLAHPVEFAAAAPRPSRRGARPARRRHRKWPPTTG